MNFYESFKTSLKELASHKLRSFLTMLGVILGVLAVVSMVSIAEGARVESEKSFENIGLDTLTVERVPLTGDILEESLIKSPEGINLGDVLFLKNAGGLLKDAVGIRKCKAKIDSDEKYSDFNLLGTFSEFCAISKFTVNEGRFFGKDEVENQARVCVLGASVADRLFPAGGAAGKKIRFLFHWYTVIGVLNPKIIADSEESNNFGFSGENKTFGFSGENNNIYIPITSSITDFEFKYEKESEDEKESQRRESEKISKLKLESNPVSQIVVQVKDIKDLKEAALAADSYLERRHRGIRDYRISIPLEFLEIKQKSQKIFNIVMFAIAGISLLVGGIGIMNIMLATITQRIREIGVRRCLGATKRDILLQFLIECLVITMMGGILGIILGIGFSKIITMYAGWSTIVSLKAILISFVVSVSVGIIFGLYPARQASEINPIDALRYE